MAAMNCKRILSSLRLRNSLFFTQLSRAPSPNNQVTQYFYLSTILGARQNVFFSSKPEYFVDIIITNEWSKQLERDLGKLDFPVNHEAVMGLMKDFWTTIKEMKENGFYIDEETYKSINSIFRNLKMETYATALKHFYGRMIKENAMGDLAKDVSELIKKQEWGIELERELGEMKLLVSDNFVLRVLKELREIGYPLKAYSFFKWVARNKVFSTTLLLIMGFLGFFAEKSRLNSFGVW
ncbi:hypothetical protein K7X08_021431 [Anisodus acutangulus]|uniref:Uncharacterized protein n=1 Tax=Anisodus acutangulus TaxID=402998 RepID=A0A9Q1RC83_9SOLA|nr:hypothetical protein K7X08_021431 [Anisodus acutangulus]